MPYVPQLAPTIYLMTAAAPIAVSPSLATTRAERVTIEVGAVARDGVPRRDEAGPATRIGADGAT